MPLYKDGPTLLWHQISINCLFHVETNLTQLIMAQCSNPVQSKQITVNERESDKKKRVPREAGT